MGWKKFKKFINPVQAYIEPKQRAELADFEDDFKKAHTLGQFVENASGSNDLARLFDPAYESVQHDVDPVAFGAPGKDNPITGVEGGGIFDDPYISAALNFIPVVGSAISAGGSMINKQSDYEQAKAAGYNPDYGQSVVKPAAMTAGTYALNTSNGGDPYGYGTSVGGKAGTAATTSGLMSAAGGQTTDQQVRNAAIAGLSTYGGGYLAEQTGSADAGKFGASATNLGLRELWKDPEATDMGDYYSGLVDNFTRFKNQTSNYDEPMIGLNELENTPEGSRLLELFQQQEGTMQAKKSRAGGAGQFASSNDQLEQSDGQETYLI